MDNQEKLLQAIRKISTSTSLIDELATILGISYDAAHRRISQKSKFSIEETILLCRHYSLSMDLLFSGSQKVIVEKTNEIRSMQDMEAYFRDSAQRIREYGNFPDTVMYYSAKDIPLFYTIGGTLLSKFKLYVWLTLLSGTQSQDKFENFSVNHSFLEYSSGLKAVHDTVTVNEIWNDTTINSTLQQVYYFFQSGLVTLSSAILLCEDLKKILYTAEERCTKTDSGFNLYYNELLILNNNVLLSSKQQQSLFVPYTMLGYFITADADTCQNASDFFKQQVKNSKSLNQSGTRDRKLFFNKSHQKIDFYLGKMNAEVEISF